MIISAIMFVTVDDYKMAVFTADSGTKYLDHDTGNYSPYAITSNKLLLKKCIAFS